MIKVLLVDDHGLLRAGIRKLLDDQEGIKVIGETASGELAINFIRDAHAKPDLYPDIILMDVKMPGIGGLEATHRILRIDPQIKIIIVSSCNEEPFPSRLLEAGASGYLTKGSSIDEILSAIHKVVEGEKYISPDIAQALAFKNLKANEKTPFDKLSERELQVMLMITSGQKVPEISKKLCLSSKTVNSYRYRLFEKLGINSDVELTHLAIRYGVLEKYNLDELLNTSVNSGEESAS